MHINGRNWSFFVGFILNGDNIYEIQPKYSRTDYNQLFKYIVVSKKSRSDEYLNAIACLFARITFDNQIEVTYSNSFPSYVEFYGLITAFRNHIKTIVKTHPDQKILEVLSSLSRCYINRRFREFPFFLFDTSRMFELYVYGILCRKFKSNVLYQHKSTVLYRHKERKLIPDFLIPVTSESSNRIGIIADAKYLHGSKVDEESLKRMKNYNKYLNVGQTPICVFFCACIKGHGYTPEQIIEMDLFDIMIDLREHYYPNMYRVQVELPYLN